MQRLKTLWPLWLSLAITACSNEQLDTDFERYISRIAGTLNAAKPSASPNYPPALPDSQQFKNKTSNTALPLNISAIDLYKLNECQLGQVIAYKNSSLGKVAGSSQQLLSELKFLHFAPACIRTLENVGNTELASVIKQAVIAKREQLPSTIWRATLGGPEFRQFWQAPLSLNNYPNNTSSKPITALRELRHYISVWLNGDYQQGWGHLEPLLEEIRRVDAGAMYLALFQQQHYLQLASTLFTRSTPLCRNQQSNPRQQIILNVVKKYYVQQRQTWSADINRRYHQIMPEIWAIEALLAGAEPASFMQWRLARNSLLRQSVAAPKEHIGAFQALIADCPGPKR